MKISINLILILLTIYNCSSQPVVDNQVFTPNPARIIAKPALSLRETPEDNGKILESIPENYIIFAVEKTIQKKKVGKFVDYWYKTKFKNKTGWIFGTDLDFDAKEVSLIKMIQVSLKKPQYSTNFKKIQQYFSDNMIQKSYDDAIKEFGFPQSEIKYKGSNPHGGFNHYLELIYSDLRLKFIDKTMFEITFFASDKLKNKTIQIDSEREKLELEFETPYYMSKDLLGFLTCFPNQKECSTGYPNTITFQIENQKVKSIRFTLYLD